MNGENICIFGISKFNVEMLCEMIVPHTQTSLMLSWLQRLELVETKNKTNVDSAQPDGRQIEQVGRPVFI